MAKFGAAYGVRTGIHVGVDVLVKNVNKNLQTTLILICLFASAIFTLIITLISSHFVFELSKTSSSSEVLELPIWIIYLAIPLGSFLMCIRFIQISMIFIYDKKLPSHEIEILNESQKNTDKGKG